MIEELIMEKFKLNLFEETYDDIFIEDGAALAEQWITEAQEGANKQNIFQKIWGLIKKFFSWIAKKLSQFWKWLVSKFKRKSKTANQCVSEVVGIDAFTNAKPAGAKKEKKPAEKKEAKPNENKPAPVEQKPASTEDKKPVEIKSEVKEVKSSFDPVESVTSDIMIKFDNTSFTIYYTKIGFDKMKITLHNSGNSNIKKQSMAPETTNTLGITVFAWIVANKGQLKDYLKGFIDSIKNKEYNKMLNSMNFIDKQIVDLVDRLNSGDNFIGDISLEEYKEAMDIFNQVNTAIADANIFEEISSNVNQRGIEVFNTFLDDIRIIQYGVNYMMMNMNNMYVVDNKFMNCVHDPETLDKIVYNLIKGGIPSKYVAHNVNLITDDSMNAKGAVPMGQTRGVIFPKDDNIIYKFALNTAALLDNKKDLIISERCKNEDVVAKVLSKEPNYAVITCERLITYSDPNNKISEDRFKHAASKLQSYTKDPEFIKRTGVEIWDVGYYNVGFKDADHFYIVDYGNSNVK